MIQARHSPGSLLIMTGVLVNADNFARAETNRMFAAILQNTGGVNRWQHYREPTPVDRQTVIRMKPAQ